jgi:uncharacterized protein DUF262/uncharacterized protein DUF1524
MWSYVKRGRLVQRIEIKGEQQTISEVFSERYAFEVPPYQRPYAWTTEHAGELLEDLLGFLGDDEPVDEMSPYFLGSVVLVKRERPEAQIVDGQQRLVTLTILLAVLRALVPEQYRESITHRLYEAADPLNNSPARYRVRMKERDNGLFQHFIQSDGGIQRLRSQAHPSLSESQRNICQNALFYVREVEQMPATRRVRLAQFIIQRCMLIIVSTPDLGAAYRIFSVLNNRGLDLTVADLLKAEIIGTIAANRQTEYTERWEAIEERLGSGDFSAFFGHVTAVHHKAPQRATTLEEFRQYVSPAATDAEHLIDDIILPMGAAYYLVQNCAYEPEQSEAAQRINTTLRWLVKIDNTDWAPVAISYFAKYHDQPERLSPFLVKLERLAASLMIRRQYRHRRIPRYAAVLRAIEQGEDLSKPDSPIQLTQHERDDAVNTLNSDFYLMPATPRNYVLRRLDSSLAGTSAIYDRKTLTVEHVLPRNPVEGSEWSRWYPTAEIHTKWIHRLGNLVLLARTKNAAASNYDFAKKKATYFAGRGGISPFALTTQVLQEREWTPEVVERRQAELIAHLRALWQL